MKKHTERYLSYVQNQQGLNRKQRMVLQFLFFCVYMLVELPGNLFDTVMDTRKLLKCPGLENVFPLFFGSWMKIDCILIMLLELSHEVHRSLVYGSEIVVGILRVGYDHVSFHILSHRMISV